MSDYIPAGNVIKPASITLVDTTTRVLGGLDGPANTATKQLADWCYWLENELENLNIEVPAASHTTAGIALLAYPADAANGNYDDRSVTPAGLLTVLNARTATTAATGLIQLATTAEAQAQTDANKAITPATLSAVLGGLNSTVPVASHTTPGITRLAYPAEASSANYDDCAVTPAGLLQTLNTRTAATSTTGLIQLATTAEANAKTDPNKAITPATLGAVLAGLNTSVPAASHTTAGIALLAYPADAANGSYDDRSVTPAGLLTVLNARTATTVATGLIQLATSAEAQAQTDANKAITASTMASVTSTTSRVGLVQLATSAEAQALTNATKAITPATLSAAYGYLTVPGQIIWVASANAPTGTLKANGGCVLVASYSRLATAIYCGDANNSTAEWGYRCTASNGTGRSTSGSYIVLPDLRGMFIRGYDEGRGIDTARNLFLAQLDAVGIRVVAGNNQTASAIMVVTPHTSPYPTTDATDGLTGGSAFSDGGTSSISRIGGNLRSASETRPRNVAMLACIIY